MATVNIQTIDHLSPDQKQQLLALLVRSLLAASGGALSVTDAFGELVVYAVPPDARARAERAMNEADPVRLAELRRRAAIAEQSMSLEEVMGVANPPRPVQ